MRHSLTPPPTSFPAWPCRRELEAQKARITGSDKDNLVEAVNEIREQSQQPCRRDDSHTGAHYVGPLAVPDHTMLCDLGGTPPPTPAKLCEVVWNNLSVPA